MSQIEVATSKSPPVISPRRSRWRRYSLRTLLIFTTIFCVFFAYFVRQSQRQKYAVAQLTQSNKVLIYYEDKWKDTSFFLIKNPLQPAIDWVRGFIGEDFFKSVISINVMEGSVNDDTLKLMTSFPKLKILTFDFIDENSKVTDAGLASLAELTELWHLIFRNASFDGSGLEHFGSAEKMDHFEAIKTNMNDGGMKHVGKMKNLTSLIIAWANVTDAGLVHLESMHSLRHLNLRNTAITDKGLKHLADKKSLRVLILPGGVTESGRAWLQQELPHCRIDVLNY